MLPPSPVWSCMAFFGYIAVLMIRPSDTRFIRGSIQLLQLFMLVASVGAASGIVLFATGSIAMTTSLLTCRKSWQTCAATIVMGVGLFIPTTIGAMAFRIPLRYSVNFAHLRPGNLEWRQQIIKQVQAVQGDSGAVPWHTFLLYRIAVTPSLTPAFWLEGASVYKLPPRAALEFMWVVLRSLTVFLGLAEAIEAALHTAAGNGGHRATFGTWVLSAVSMFLGLASTRRNRQLVYAQLSRFTHTQEERQAIAIAALCGRVTHTKVRSESVCP